MEINAPFNVISARRARDLMGVTAIVNRVTSARLLDLGFIGDGVPHPLSEKFLNLAAAQAVFPRAASLTEQLDGHALQRFIDTNTASRCVVSIPPGSTFFISNPIYSGQSAVDVYGNGSTLVQNTAGKNGWEHGTVASGFPAAYFAGFRMYQMTLQCVGVGGTALKIELHPASGEFVMEDVWVTGRGNQTANYWVRAGETSSASNTTFRNVRSTGKNGGDLTTTQDAWTFRHDNARFPRPAGSFIYRFTDCDIGGFNSAYFFDITIPMEGIWITGGNVNQCMHVMKTRNTFFPEEAYRAPQYYVTGLQAECYGTYFDFGGAKYCRVSDCLFIVSGPHAGVASLPDYSWDLFKVSGQGFQVVIEGNHIEMLPGCKPRVILDVHEAAALVTMRHNHFGFNAGSDCLGLIDFGQENQGRHTIREYDNTGLKFAWAVGVGGVQRAEGNFSQASIQNRLNALGQGDKVTAINPATGEVTLIGSRVGTTDANGRITIDLPGYTFGGPPWIMAALGDDIGGETVVPVLGASNSARIVLRVTGAAAGVTRRVTFTAIG